MRHLTFPRGEVFIEFGGTRCPPLPPLYPLYHLPPWQHVLIASLTRVEPLRRLSTSNATAATAAAVAPAIKSPFAAKKKYLAPCYSLPRPSAAAKRLNRPALLLLLLRGFNYVNFKYLQKA